jgi:glycerophosphoryl diester phosphodiesterase
VLVGSFSGRRIRRFRRLVGPRVATAASPGEVAAYVALPGTLARRLTSGAPAALQVPHRRGPLVVASRHLVRRAHAAGLHVHVWTVDDPTEMERLLDRGVDGLMTDRTDILRDVLRRRGAWSPE